MLEFKQLPKLNLVALLLLSACAAIPASTPAATVGVTAAPGTEVAESPTSAAATENQGSINLSIWLPPVFDPSGGNLAANILQHRLEEFDEQNPQVRLEVRIKAEEGTGGLLDSMLAAKAAAPLALPDLILLPHTQLSAAVSSELLFPLAGLSETLDSDDWYPFAKEMSQVGSSVYGLPFTADALIMAFRPAALPLVPTTWSALRETGLTLGFAAADPDAYFTFNQLRSLPPASEQESDAPQFDEETLTAVFEFLDQGQQQEIFPFWLSQYQTTEQSWQAFSEGRVPMVVAWTSRAFDSRNVDISSAPLPTSSGEPFTLVKGWVWAISTPDSSRSTLVAELAEFLTTPEFTAQWTAAAGYLPPRHSSLSAWSPGDKQTLASQIVETAAALPEEATLDLWGGPLSQAVVGLLKEELTPAEAVELVLSEVESN